MACYNPGAGWKGNYVNPETGKRPIVYSPKEGLLDEPVSIPCGKCTGCLADESLMWSVRCYHESSMYDFNSFLTLTYDDDNLPPDNKINKPDFQNFLKRLRHEFPVRYLGCGEYGETTGRPHYHFLIFGQNFNHWKYKRSLGDNLYTHTKIEEIWGKGNIMIAEMNLQTIMYTCGYVHKKVGDDNVFRLMSKGRRPPVGDGGIGYRWLLNNWQDLLKTNSVTIEGREFPIPPRYLDWMDKELGALKATRKEYALAKAQTYGPLSLRNKEKNRKAKLNLRNKGDT